MLSQQHGCSRGSVWHTWSASCGCAPARPGAGWQSAAAATCCTMQWTRLSTCREKLTGVSALSVALSDVSPSEDLGWSPLYFVHIVICTYVGSATASLAIKLTTKHLCLISCAVWPGRMQSCARMRVRSQGENHLQHPKKLKQICFSASTVKATPL